MSLSVKILIRETIIKILSHKTFYMVVALLPLDDFNCLQAKEGFAHLGVNETTMANSSVVCLTHAIAPNCSTRCWTNQQQSTSLICQCQWRKDIIYPGL